MSNSFESGLKALESHETELQPDLLKRIEELKKQYPVVEVSDYEERDTPEDLARDLDGEQRYKDLLVLYRQLPATECEIGEELYIKKVDDKTVLGRLGFEGYEGEPILSFAFCSAEVAAIFLNYGAEQDLKKIKEIEARDNARREAYEALNLSSPEVVSEIRDEDIEEEVEKWDAKWEKDPSTREEDLRLLKEALAKYREGGYNAYKSFCWPKPGVRLYNEVWKLEDLEKLYDKLSEKL
ncbi:MAG: hypothetical protein ABII13_04640 [Patescibacteria group bacterium]|nr:hypothetical protein [Patescibacteria group bacterium]